MILLELLIEVGQTVLDEVANIDRLPCNLIDQWEHRRTITSNSCFDKSLDRLHGWNTEERCDVTRCDISQNTHLLQILDRITHTTLSQTSNQLKTITLTSQTFWCTDKCKSCYDTIPRNLTEIEHLTTRDDRIWHLVRISRRKDKHKVFGRFFHNFEQRIERTLTEHMDFVNNIHLLAQHRRWVDRLTDDLLTHIVHTSMTRCIDLDNIHRLTRVDGYTVGACVTRIASLWVETVDRFGQDPGDWRLTDTSGSEEQIVMIDLTSHHLLLEDIFGGILLHEIIEGLWAVFGIEGHNTEAKS